MSYSCTLTKKHSFLLLETNKCRKAYALAMTLYLFMFGLNLFLHKFRNELTRSLTKGNLFSSLYDGYNDI